MKNLPPARKSLSHFENEGEWLDDQRLQRLVDGELRGEDFRKAVQLLEAEPQGWRRCALAFLEEQAWRNESLLVAMEFTLASELTDRKRAEERLVEEEGTSEGVGLDSLPKINGHGTVKEQSIHEEPSDDRLQRNGSQPNVLNNHSHAQKQSYWQSRAVTMGALAACFITFFGFGALWQQQRSSVPKAHVTQNQNQNDKELFAQSQSDSDQNRETSRESVNAMPVGNLYMGEVKTGDGRQEIIDQELSVPIYHASEVDSAWMLQQEISPISPEVIESFQRLGLQVERRREVLTLPLEDGRQVLVPVERVQFVPADMYSRFQ
ncbi:MAG: hypothetical protein MPJ24_06520 [Pirellulaceae bacterium]|nr:hypothetical protein [Pirellulaceae bacterium]